LVKKIFLETITSQIYNTRAGFGSGSGGKDSGAWIWQKGPDMTGIWIRIRIPDTASHRITSQEEREPQSQNHKQETMKALPQNCQLREMRAPYIELLARN
jgi:hypothetical protein